MRIKGKYFWKSHWRSICSNHREYDSTCHICNTGYWANDIISFISRKVYKYTPGFWRWWVNTTFMRVFGTSHRFLRKTFPNLK